MSNKTIKIPVIKNGFTIIELLIYIVLISIFVTSAITFSWDIIYGRERTNRQQVVEQSARIALSKIIYEIERAKNIQSISDNTIILDNGSSTTTVSLSSGVLQITSNGTGPYNLTSNEVTVLQSPQVPLFKDLRTADKNSKSIGVNITIKAVQAGNQPDVQTSISDSVELNSQFNQARSLIMNASNVFLNNGYKDLINATLENSGPSNITIDQIIVSWTGGGQGSNVTEIRINGLSVFGPGGSAGSGIPINIQDTTIPSGTSTIPIDYFKFSSDMSNTVITITFIMTDGSKSKTTIDFT